MNHIVKKALTMLCCFVGMGEAGLNLNGATAVTGVPQGSSGKYNISVAFPFTMRFDVPSISNGPFTFQSFQLGLSANNNSDPLTMSLQSTTGLDISQQINFNDAGIGSGNSAPNTILSFTTAGAQALTTGTYSLVFTVTTDAEWTITEAYTSFVFAEEGNLANTVNDISISNFANASDGSVNPVPEPRDFAILAGFGLIAFGFYRKAYRLPKRA